MIHRDEALRRCRDRWGYPEIPLGRADIPGLDLTDPEFIAESARLLHAMSIRPPACSRRGDGCGCDQIPSQLSAVIREAVSSAAAIHASDSRS